MTVADERLLADVRRMHEQVRVAVGRRLEQARASGRAELANRPGRWVAGDIAYALDDVAQAALADFVERVGTRRPVSLVAEGSGVLAAAPEQGAGEAPVRLLVDPVDGTRPLMHDMRSAWVLTGVAPDRGADTRLSHVELAVQTELPTTSARVYRVLTAWRGRGTTLARHDVQSGELLDEAALQVDPDLPLDNGYVCFGRYLVEERPHVAALEQRFLTAAIDALGLEPRLIYDDQYLCSAGQLFLLATGRYRLLADLRAWLGRRHGLANFSVKPYDMAAMLCATEAGVPVLDAQGRALDAPFDTETALDVVAYGNERMRRAYEPHLRAALEA